jgi:hypothetical protein
MRQMIGAVLVLCLAAGCSDDTDKPNDAALQPDTHADPQDAAVKQDGAVFADGLTYDAPVKTDANMGTWGCTQKPGGGPFSTRHSDGCRWDWTCTTTDDRQLYCETISTKEHTCSCKNLKTSQVEKSFKSVNICTFSNTAITAEANKHCGWKL